MGKGNQTLLRRAIVVNQLHVAEYLLRHGADPHARDFMGISPLWFAARARKVSPTPYPLWGTFHMFHIGTGYWHVITYPLPPMEHVPPGSHWEWVLAWQEPHRALWVSVLVAGTLLWSRVCE
jgi:hypothetical protein